MWILGRDLKVNDTIEVWWGNHRDTIIRLIPYTGPLAGCFEQGAQIAVFAIYTTGMTIDNGERYIVLNRPAEGG